LQPDGFEILTVAWYGPDELEDLVSPLNQRRLPRVLAEPDRLHNLRNGDPI
jgi:hypothetical protein